MKRDLICPARRKLIKAAPFIAAAPFILKSSLAKSMLYHGGLNGALASPPVQPSLAASNGFNTNILWDDFTSLSTIDINNTGAAGFNWYLQTYVSNGTIYNLPGNTLSVANSILKIAPSAPNQGWLNNVGYLGAGAPRTVGNPIIATGAYFEASIAMDALLPPYGPALANNGTFPQISGAAWWINDLQLQLDQGDHLNTSVPLGEIDFYEYGVLGPNVLDFAIHNWTAYNNSGNTFSTTPGGLTSAINFNKIGCLWKSMAQNAGTGTVDLYINNTKTSGVTYTAGQPYSCFENSPLGFLMMFGTLNGWPMLVDYVQVWK